MNVDILYLAWNRLEFTKASFGCLLENTDWSLVDRLVIYDDGSTDGTRDWLKEVTADALGHVELRATELRSPPAIMNHYLERDPNHLFAKIDNDIGVPPGWLESMLASLRTDTDIAALGMAAGWTAVKKGRPGVQPCSHIGGVGLFRSAKIPLPVWSHGRHGWTEQQHKTESIHTAWVTPDVAAVQLDLIPEEPWASLADYYVSKKWARWWPTYDPANHEWWDWIPVPVTA